MVLACYLGVEAAIHCNWLSPPADPGAQSPEDKDFQEGMAQKILAMIRLTFTYQPQATLQAQVSSTLSSKIQASQRSRPTTIQMLFMFLRIVKVRAATSRKSKQELLRSAIKEYNDHVVAHLRLGADEIDTIEFLAQRSPLFQRRVKLAWGPEKPQYTAMPMSLVASHFLKPGYVLPVSKETNPLWHRTWVITEAVFEEWIARVLGRFNKLLAEKIALNKQPDLHNHASNYRDEKPEAVFRMVVYWVVHSAEREANTSPERNKELVRMFRQGLLDHELLNSCAMLSKSMEFCRFNFMQSRTVAEAHALRDGGDQESSELTQAEAAAHVANFATAKLRLAMEQTSWRMYRKAIVEFENHGRDVLAAHLIRIADAQALEADKILASRFVFGVAEDAAAALRHVCCKDHIMRLSGFRRGLPSSRVLRFTESAFY